VLVVDFLNEEENEEVYAFYLMNSKLKMIKFIIFCTIFFTSFLMIVIDTSINRSWSESSDFKYSKEFNEFFEEINKYVNKNKK
jgi:hypothetical protein